MWSRAALISRGIDDNGRREVKIVANGDQRFCPPWKVVTGRYQTEQRRRQWPSGTSGR